MKIRIHQNSIRVRLSVHDIQELKQGEVVDEVLTFSHSHTHTYQMLASDVNEIKLGDHLITITINKENLQNKHISIQWITEGGSEILVESDIYG